MPELDLKALEELARSHHKDTWSRDVRKLAEGTLEAIALIAELRGQVAGREQIERVARSHRRLTARLRDLAADLRRRDEEVLSIRDRTPDHRVALGHERLASEVRHIAGKLEAILSSLDAEPESEAGSNALRSTRAADLHAALESEASG